MNEAEYEKHWHLDKKVPIGLIFALLAQAAMVIWYAGKLEQRIALIERSVVTQERRDDSQDLVNATAVNQIRQQLDRIDAKLDRLIEARGSKL